MKSTRTKRECQNRHNNNNSSSNENEKIVDDDDVDATSKMKNHSVARVCCVCLFANRNQRQLSNNQKSNHTPNRRANASHGNDVVVVVIQFLLLPCVVSQDRQIRTKIG